MTRYVGVALQGAIARFKKQAGTATLLSGDTQAPID